jgi:hypothetical protein
MIKGALEVTEQEARNAFRAGATVEWRIRDAKEAVAETVHGFFSEPLMKQIYSGAHVWDVGGAAGIDFFRTGKISHQWVVLELLNTWEEYARNMAEKGLVFMPCTADFGLTNMGGKQVLHCAGSMQYRECPLEFLRTNSKYCKYVVLKDVPIANKTVLCCQVRVGLSWFFSVEDLCNALQDFKLLNDIGPEGVYEHEHHVPEGIKLHSIKNFVFGRS